MTTIKSKKMKVLTSLTIISAVISTSLLLTSCAENNSSIANDEEIVVADVSSAEEQHRQVAMAQAKKSYEVRQKHKKYQAQPMMAISGMYPPTQLIMMTEQNDENYRHVDENGINLVNQQPVSTFSIDVDTASYSNVRRLLNQGSLPQHDVVRVEEMINYFSYDYPQPKSQPTNGILNAPFSVYTEVGPSPYNKGKKLIHIGIQGKKVTNDARPAANLVFLLDVSGSMNRANKLGLLKNALKMLSKQLNAKDKVAIVVYAGAAGVVLEPTSGDNSRAIIDALTQLTAGGSTNGGEGIELAYNLAKKSFIKEGINRVILATDGDFNVGTTNEQQLKQLIEEKRKSGIALSILGFGIGNYNDALMQEIAQNGNGNAYYIDNLNEARKVLVEDLSSTLMTIAKDVKIQVEFNPALVSEYRLIGYETRALKREDFNNDKVDAGEIGAGHSVTALYEITLVGSDSGSIDALRYATDKKSEHSNKQVSPNKNELAFLRLRYKAPKESQSKLIEVVINNDEIKQASQMSDNYNFSAAVAGFAQQLRGSKQLSTMDFDTVIALAQKSKGEDKQGYRSEFINMVKLAQVLAQ